MSFPSTSPHLHKIGKLDLIQNLRIFSSWVQHFYWNSFVAPGPDIIQKCTSNVHIFLITFKLRDTGTCFIQKIYAPSSTGRGRGGGIYFLNETCACVARSWRWYRFPVYIKTMQSCSSMFDISSQSFQRQNDQEVHAISCFFPLRSRRTAICVLHTRKWRHPCTL